MSGMRDKYWKLEEIMRKIFILIYFILFAGTASALTTNITKLPSQVNDGTAAVGVHGDHPTTWSDGSWQANGADYSKLYVTPLELFGRDNVTIGELTYISYFTKKDSTHTSSAPDWYFQIYTKPYNGSPGDSLYGNRINSEPYFSESLNDPANTWNLWQTDADIDNRLRFYDSSLGYSGAYSDPFLSDFTSSSIYMDQEILYIAVGTSTDWASGFYGQIDGLGIVLSNGDTANVNFETTPVPGAFVLTGIGIVFVTKLKRRKIL